MSMASGLKCVCRSATIDLSSTFEYTLGNENRDNVSKNVLREAAKGILPEDVRLRRKSPYPKTHNPHYEEAVKTLLDGIISDPNAPILALCDKTKLMSLWTAVRQITVSRFRSAYGRTAVYRIYCADELFA